MGSNWRELVGGLVFLIGATGIGFAQAVPPTPVETASPDVFSDGAAGALVHRASGFVFPQILGDMPRRKFRIFASDDVSVDYTLLGGGNGDPWIDVIVYPAPRSLEDEARGVEGELVRNLGGTPLATQPPLPASARGAIGRWFEGVIQNRPMTSGYIIVKRGHWYILARGTSPRNGGARGMERLLAALAAVDWSWDQPR